MLRIRHAGGQVTTLPDGAFVEIVDPATTKVGAVFYSPTRGQVLQIMPDSSDALRYSKMFPEVAFADAVIQRGARG